MTTRQIRNNAQCVREEDEEVSVEKRKKSSRDMTAGCGQRAEAILCMYAMHFCGNDDVKITDFKVLTTHCILATLTGFHEAKDGVVETYSTVWYCTEKPRVC